MRRLALATFILFFVFADSVFAACTAAKQNADYSSVGGTSTSMTVTIHGTTDVVAITAWCFQHCTMPATIPVGTQTATRTSNVTPGTATGADGLFTGQGAIYYILSSTVSGTATATLSPTNFTGPGGPQTQLSYIDFSITGAGCTVTHDVDSPVGSLNNNFTSNTATNPTISGISGDLLVNFTITTQHVNSPVGTPWSCPVYSGPGETQTCNIDVTQNGAAYDLAAATSSVANNWTLINNSTSYEAISVGFKMTQLAANTCPSGLPVTGANCVFVADNGLDSNSGAYETLPWLHAPGMPNCSGNCASFTPSAGKGIILRGGDTWHFGVTTDSAGNPASGGEWHMDNWVGNNATCAYEGVTSGCIYWGTDPTWFAGSSFARPIINGDNPVGNPALNGANPLVSSCAHQVGTDNIMVRIYNAAYVDDLEFTGFCTSRNPGNTGPSQDLMLAYSGDGPVFETNIYMHGWSATTAAGTSNNTPPCTLLGGSTQSTAQQFIVGLVIDGADSNTGACAWGLFPSFMHFKDSIVRYTSDGVGQNCHDIHDNIFEYLANLNVPTHANILECNAMAQGSTPNVWYNNTMRHINSNFFSNGQVGWWFCPNSTPEYWFNNIAYDLGLGGVANGNFWAVAGTIQYPGCTGTGTQKMFNNTFSGGMQPCFLSGSNNNQGGFLTVYNEHLINSPWDSSTPGHTNACVGLNDSSDISMTWSISHAQGYTTGSAGISDADTCARDTTTPCSPTLVSNGTVGVGRNEQAFCTALASYSSEPAIGTEAANACKYGTTDGCAYVTSNHTMSCPGQTPVARPLTAAWDSGAYQFSAGSGNNFNAACNESHTTTPLLAQQAQHNPTLVETQTTTPNVNENASLHKTETETNVTNPSVFAQIPNSSLICVQRH